MRAGPLLLIAGAHLHKSELFTTAVASVGTARFDVLHARYSDDSVEQKHGINILSTRCHTDVNLRTRINGPNERLQFNKKIPFPRNLRCAMSPVETY